MRTEDGSLIYKCLNGEPGAFGVLVDKYKEGIYAFVYDKLKNFQDAQDVTQEVFLQAYRGLDSLRRWESFGFWLFRIAYARCGEWLRVESRRADRESIEDQEPKVMENHSLDSYREDQLDQSIAEALDSLPETHREVLLLRYFGGMNSKEMAKAMGISPGAVRTRLTRARAQLKEEMIAMMDTAYQKLPAGFTLSIVEAVKRIKIQPTTPKSSGLPWGFSLAMGIIVTILSLNPHLSIPRDIGIPGGSPVLLETKVLKTGEIPVDIMKVDKISVISQQQEDNDGGNSQNMLLLAPHQDQGGTWKKRADMPTARDGLSTSVVNGKIYAIGGWTVINPEVATIEEYNPATDTWTNKADMPTARTLFSTSVVNGKIYAIGGANEGANNGLSVVEEYNPATDKWTRKADMPTPRFGLSTCAVGGRIYAISGVVDPNKGPVTPVVEEYDPATDTWTRKANIPTARYHLSTSSVNGMIYAMGGFTKDGWGDPLSAVEEYDPITDKWAKKANMPTPSGLFSTSVVDGQIYATGGCIGWVSALSKVEIYDPVADSWELGPDMPTARRGLSASAVDGKIYVIGGSTAADVPLSIVEEYDPGFTEVEPSGKLPTKWGEIKPR